MPTLWDFSAARRWCVWLNERRVNADGRERITKVPYGRGWRHAEADDPDTWISLNEARAMLGQAYTGDDGSGSGGPGCSGPGGGVGIFLGDLGDGPGGASQGALAGFDLDSCIGSRGAEEWAAETLGALGGYWEVSPSGRGIKCFALMDADTSSPSAAGGLSIHRDILGIEPGKTGRKYSLPSVDAEGTEGTGGRKGDHPPGIEIYVRQRFFAVTGSDLDMQRTALTVLDAERVEALRVRVLDRWFGGIGRKSGISSGSAAASGVWDEAQSLGIGWEEMQRDPDEREKEILDRLLDARPRARALWDGDYSGLRNAGDRSSAAVALMAMLREAGFERPQIWRLLRWNGVGGWFEEKALDMGGRQLLRAWNAGAAGVWRGGFPPMDVVKIDLDKPGGAEVGRDNGADSDKGDENNPIASFKPQAAASAMEDLSEGSLADQMISDHRHNIRYDIEEAQWHIWDEFRWKRVKPDGVRRISHEVCRKACILVPAGPARARQIATLKSARTMNAVEAIARTDPRIQARADTWDADPWLLNTPDGILDLRNGKTRPADRLAFMTRVTAASPDFIASHPHWSNFLAQVTNGDRELEAYLARVAGYCLTGLTREQALFFLYGGGGNGKGTFVNTLMQIMGEDYAHAAQMGMLTASRQQRHPTEIAELRGRRLVTTAETEKGTAWAESKINNLTGGDKITAHFMHADNFSFMPQFKLMVSGNFKPKLHAVNDAVKRRFNLIPFLVTFKGREDKDLKDKLESEAGAILAWMARGAIDWQQNGLCTPAIVKRATDEYFKAEDIQSAWFSECCRRGPGETEESALYNSWAMWSTRMGEDKLKLKDLMEWFDQHNFNSGYNIIKRKVRRGVTLIEPGNFNRQDAIPNSPNVSDD